MSNEQLKGKNSLLKRCKNGEITVTDKSGKFAEVETSLYKEAAKVHIKDYSLNYSKTKTNKKVIQLQCICKTTYSYAASYNNSSVFLAM